MNSSERGDMALKASSALSAGGSPSTGSGRSGKIGSAETRSSQAGAAEPASPGRRRSAPSGGSEAHAVASVGAPASWPYPRWIAHRGAGKLAPENTLAAFKLGASLGYRMFECDVKLSADGVPFLLHDATLDRTTNGHGVAGQQIGRAHV